ncbi:hypothetical protein ISN45_At01g006570 [Arabidopsis thaliana x Arabidopsis arenosa]|nr:alternative NAD(P)H dehydrogenase [Arabidopsis thaliana]ANM58886.1 alternative NAD(P)H dehydrogenase [Arabidopsis thaliana]KAG7596137.1 hypothetical protein ISN44_As06g006360 [Arabidopsis suecica]KAG7645402.1 hypothetical protein ISN45_At01g006570 [Arabidopsis thaliana x Arabidopsis arenosa]OAP16259.1 hypothetical protein AXX17_AT1G06810 [Arabidopsis thaliana]|eukprot:NP_001117241.1 alternative NAD(P)H dehydrogenase [Arabidopsis thaliana]
MVFCYAIRLCLCIFLALSIVSSARLTFSFSENEKMMVRGRSLMVSTNDYGEPSANAKHNPPGRRRGGGRRG